MVPAVNVYWQGCWYGPAYSAAGDPQGWPAEDGPLEVDDESAVAGPAPVPPAATPAPESAEDPVPPPQRGAGSSKQAWADYATQLGVGVDPHGSRDDIIDAVAAAGYPVGDPR